jgi:hypothetical protein
VSGRATVVVVGERAAAATHPTRAPTHERTHVPNNPRTCPPTDLHAHPFVFVHPPPRRYLEERNIGITQVIEWMGELVRGADPLPFGRVVAQLRANTRHIVGGIASQAVAAIENALLDVVGKALGVPACALFGGPQRTELPVYVECMVLRGHISFFVAGGVTVFISVRACGFSRPPIHTHEQRQCSEALITEHPRANTLKFISRCVMSVSMLSCGQVLVTLRLLPPRPPSPPAQPGPGLAATHAATADDGGPAQTVRRGQAQRAHVTQDQHIPVPGTRRRRWRRRRRRRRRWRWRRRQWRQERQHRCGD